MSAHGQPSQHHQLGPSLTAALAPSFFDRSFRHLGIEFTTSRRCSWENYSAYIGVIRDLKDLLTEKLSADVSLLDAHSFAWILANQMESDEKLADVSDYLNLSPSEREGVVKARIGQGKFRQSVIDYWTCCVVTGCTETALLVASHIRPWSDASLVDRTNPYNGLLLSPNVDAAFDAGYISFDSDGCLLISPRLAPDDASALGLRKDVRLRRLDVEHEKYLKYHRENVFKNGKETGAHSSEK